MGAPHLQLVSVGKRSLSNFAHFQSSVVYFFLRFYDLDQIAGQSALYKAFMWQPISSAPFDRDLELAVVDKDEHHALVFPCRRISGGWMNAGSKKRIDVSPTHWREWVEKR